MNIRTTKSFRRKRQKDLRHLHSILWVFLFFLSACSDSPDNSSQTSSDTGSIAFSVEWNDSTTNHLAARAFNESKLLRIAELVFLPSLAMAAPLDCEATGVATVMAMVYDGSGSKVTEGGPWDCSLHTGTIQNVPAGTNRKVVILGKDSDGNILYQGEQAGITVTAGETPPPVTIEAHAFVPMLSAPRDGSTVTAAGFSFEWTPVTRAVEYKIHVSTDNSFTSALINETVTTTSFTLRGPVTPDDISTTVFDNVLSYNGHVYAVTTGSMTWDMANTLAEQHGGCLVTINDAGENQFLTDNYSFLLLELLWIGYNDKDDEGTWVWANGETATYTNWDDGEPNNAGDEDCAEIYTSGVWNDDGCWRTRRAIVEWEPTLDPNLPLSDGIYYWRVRADDSYGNKSAWSEAWSIEVSTEPGTAPSALTNVRAIAGDSQVTISWDSVSGATSYNIYWSTSTGVSKTNYEGKIQDIDTTSYTHTGLTNGTTYYYVVTAENDYGESDESSEVSATPVAVVWYVDGDVGTSGDGQGWDTAFKMIQEAIDAASDGDEIWVKQGSYNLSDQIEVNKPVAIYAGFDGRESQRDQRNWQNNVTTVDGKNAVRCFNVSADATIDGFTITGGYDSSGAGMYNYTNTAPIITNCTFSENQADSGGGMYNNNDASPTVTNCTFQNNSATADGGGMYNRTAEPMVTNCTFDGNSANVGGGIYYTDGSSGDVSSCTITGNTATNLAGGIHCYRGASPTITNCIITGNTAHLGGGIVCQDYAIPTITNCTITENLAYYYGGGFLCHGYPSSPSITNCIVWANTPDNMGCGTATVTYCDVDQDGYEGINANIREDPRFVDSSNGDFHLHFFSPCIDAGDNDAVPADTADLDGDGDTDEPVPFDLDGNPRIVGTVDMGAYERGPAVFDSITLEEIMSASLSSDQINGSNNSSNQIPTGTILLYQTDMGRYGKLEIVLYGYDLTLRWRTYDTDESIYSEGDNLVIHGTWSCDLDLGEEVASPTSGDFFWQQQTDVIRYLAPQNGATFAVYGQ